MVFFAIWWAWMNFTWFASAYDTDDVAVPAAHRCVQMAGVLVLAAGVPRRVRARDFDTVFARLRRSCGWRWSRCGCGPPASDPDARRTALPLRRGGVTVVQVLWIGLARCCPAPWGSSAS